MNVQTILQDLILKNQSHPLRMNHVYGVKNTALKLGKIHGCDLTSIERVAYLHDFTKHDTESFHKQWILRVYDENILHEYALPLYHAYSAAAYAKLHYGITDLDELRAIESHTVGRKNMSILEKIIFIADYIEPNRLYPSCVATREIAFVDLNQAVYKAIDSSIRYYENIGGFVPKTAYIARDFYQPKEN